MLKCFIKVCFCRQRSREDLNGTLFEKIAFKILFACGCWGYSKVSLAEQTLSTDPINTEQIIIWFSQLHTQITCRVLFWNICPLFGKHWGEIWNSSRDSPLSRFGGGRLWTDGGNILLTNESQSVSALVWRKGTSSMTQMLRKQSSMFNQGASRSEPLWMIA